MEQQDHTTSENSTCLTKKEITFIAKNVGCDVQRFARQLDLAKWQFDELHSGRDLQENVNKVIEWWTQKEGKNATKEAMVKALRNIPRTDIADELCTSSEKTDLTDFTKVQKWLTDFYLRIGIPEPPGIQLDKFYDEVFIEQEMETYYDPELNDEVQSVKLKNLFQTSKGKLATRILVEGDPGFGKTTLATQLATDWSKQQHYIASQFSLVVLVYLNEINDDESLEDIIVEIINYNESYTLGKPLVCKQDLPQFLVQANALVILDGYDEMTFVGRYKLQSILSKKTLESTCILVTSRRGIFPPRKSLRHATSRPGKNKDLQLWDSRVVLKGLTVDQRNELLRQHFKINWQQMEKTLRELSRGDKTDMLRCPLFVIWIGFLFENMNTKSQEFGTKTTLFKSLINLILYKTLVREKLIDGDDSFDMFKEDKRFEKLKTEINIFGKFALERLQNHELKITASDLQDVLPTDSLLFKSSLLIPYKSIRSHKEETCYQIMHRTILEFLAALYVSDLQNENINEIISKLMKQQLMPSMESFFYPFLAGLLGQYAACLFNSLSPWRYIMHVCRPEMVNILMQLTCVNEDIIQSLLNFIPTWYSIAHVDDIPDDYYSSECYTILFTAALKSKTIFGMYWDLKIPQPLLSGSSDNLQRLILQPSKSIYPASVSILRCSELILSITKDTELDQCDPLPLQYWGIGACHCHIQMLHVDPSNITLILNAVKDVKRKINKFQFVERILFTGCDLQKIHLEMLVKLVQNNIITKGIHINCEKSTGMDWSPLWTAVQESNSITEFSVSGYDNLDKIVTTTTNGTPKQFELLKFKGITVDTVKTEETPCVAATQQLIVLNCQYEVSKQSDFLETFCKMVYLEYENDVFSEISLKNYPAVQYLREVTLHIKNDPDLIPSGILLMAKMPWLRTLTLDCGYVEGSETLSFLKMFLENILTTNNLQTLGLLNMNQMNVFFLISVIEKLLECQQLSLEVLQISDNQIMLDLRSEELCILKNYLMTNQLNELVLVNFAPSLHCILPSVFSKENFQFEYEIDGSKVQHSMWSRKRYLYEFAMSKRLTIKSKGLMPSVLLKEEIEFIAENIEDDAYWLGRELGLPRSELDDFNRQLDTLLNTSDAIIKLCIQISKIADKFSVVRALRNIGCPDIARHLMKMTSKSE